MNILTQQTSKTIIFTTLNILLIGLYHIFI
jgi:hypothetical protein